MGLKSIWKSNICVWGDEEMEKMKRLRGIFLIFVFLFLYSQPGVTADLYSFNSPQENQRFVNLTRELRCLVCQNQSLADSDADLAKDLRGRIHGMIQEKKTDEEIREFLVSRYGKFILFSPPLMTSTLLLWGFPALVLTVVFGGLFIFQRRR